MDFKHKGLGCLPDMPDIRDYEFLASGSDLIFSASGKLQRRLELPTMLDLRNHVDMPAIYDQQNLGSCTSHAVGAVCDFKYGIDTIYEPSKLFLYYVTRSLEGTVDIDNGATIRNTIKAANTFGVARESDWPYIIKKFNKKPPINVFQEAEHYQALNYKRVQQRLRDLRECLFLGNPIAFGIGVYEGLYEVTREEPVLKLPSLDQRLQGGHALCIVGYDDQAEFFIVRNSWGSDWGVDGYFYIPYEYVINNQLSFDFWIINLVER